MTGDDQFEPLMLYEKRLDNVENILTRVEESLVIKIDKGWSKDKNPSFVRDDLYSISMGMTSNAINVKFRSGDTQEFSLDDMNLREIEELYNWVSDCKELDGSRDSSPHSYKDTVSEDLFLKCQDCSYEDRKYLHLKALMNYDKLPTCPNHGNTMEVTVRVTRTSKWMNAISGYAKLKSLVDSFIEDDNADPDQTIEERFRKNDIAFVYYDVERPSYCTIELHSGLKEEYEIEFLSSMELQELGDWLASKLKEIGSGN